MRKIVAVEWLTLDGVMQSPGRPDEDDRDGFTRGGWMGAFQDEVMGRAMGERMSNENELLFGRRTYQDFYSVWPGRGDNPFTEVLNNTPKYVASTTLAEPLPWQNSILLKGDAADAVAELKERPGPGLVILGSGDLVQSLRRRRLIDEYVLTTCPVVFGTGRRLFPDGAAPSDLRLVDSVATTTGAIIATYREV